jgi:nucleotidyltransferase substrate binding protein (TIGR01987 family)
MINDGDGWIDMMIDRNKTSHIYDENEAKAIYKKIKVTYIYLLRELEKQIQQRLESY